jgi:hypothetical protein
MGNDAPCSRTPFPHAPGTPRPMLQHPALAGAAEEYVKPAVLRLDFEIDVNVSMAQNCKTAQSTNVGSTPCRTPGGGRGCQTIGS